MKYFSLTFLLALAFVFCCHQNSNAQQVNTQPPTKQPVVRKPIFVAPEQIDFAKLLPAPPAEGSLAAKADLAELHRIENTRTPAQVAQAQADDKEESIFLFKNIMGEKFTREALPATALLSDHIKNDEGVNVKVAKNLFRVPRPYHRDPSLKPVCKTTENKADFAYPSGHATTGYLEALVLSMIVPEKKAAIMKRADEYAHNRAVCGVHYPHDGAVSKIVATEMVRLMKNNPQFKQELASAKTEVRKILLASTLSKLETQTAR